MIKIDCTDLLSYIINFRVDLAVSTGCESFVLEEYKRQSDILSTEQIRGSDGNGDGDSGDTDGGNDTYVPQRQQQEHQQQDWPGLVSSTSHFYKHSYFDDNYYIAFRKISARSRAAAAADANASTTQNNHDSRVTTNTDYNVCDEVARSTSNSVNYNNGNTSDKKKFNFSAFSDENTVVVRRKKKMKHLPIT